MIDSEREAPPIGNEPPASVPDVPSVKSVSDLFGDFLAEVERNKQGTPISIGFPKLQEIIRPALTRGLICLGAAPSAGKTTFIMQAAYNIATAARGARDVLAFSLEMPRNELIARDLSRLTYQLPKVSGGFKGDPKTAAEILSGMTYDIGSGQRVNYTERDARLLQQAQDHYRAAARRLYIYESNREITVDDVAAIAEKFTAEHRGQPPVIIVDYLQLLAPTDSRADERRANTHNVVVLKSLSKTLGGVGTTVVAVSSTARSNYYDTAVEGFGKESGGIEYSADSTMFMQYEACFTLEGDASARERAAKAEAAKDDRAIVVSVIKNRAGRRNQHICYTYRAKYNIFEERGYLQTNGNAQQTNSSKKRANRWNDDEDDIDF